MNWLGLDKMDESPWAPYAEFSCEYVDVFDNTSQEWLPKTLDGVERVLACDGDVAALVKLKDGRYAAWESWTDVTGSGFHHDAYGGDAVVYIARTPKAALRSISEKGRESLQFDVLDEEHPLIAVLFDAFCEGRPRQELWRIAETSGEFGELYEDRVDALVREWSRP